MTDAASRQSRRLAGKVKYPAVRRQLLRLEVGDQKDRDPSTFYWQDPATVDRSVVEEAIQRDRVRADILLDFLAQIKTPSVRNIGLDGSHAAWLIAQHNPDYRSLGPLMLRKMKYLYYKDKHQVHYRGIPYLVDRLMIHRQGWRRDAKQLYGTQGYFDEHGVLHGYPIIDSAHLVERLHKFDLDLRACAALSEKGMTS